MKGQTAKDEYKYDQNLRREYEVMREVIQELREENKNLWATQYRLLTNLLQAEDALRVYRLGAQRLAQSQIEHAGSSHCLVGCNRHYWDDKDGWHKVGEEG